MSYQARFSGSILVLACFCSPLCASPRVTQASLFDIGQQHYTVLAVEDFGRSPAVIVLDDDKNLAYKIDFGNSSQIADGFTSTNPIARFVLIYEHGLPQPIIAAVQMAPGMSDEVFRVDLIANDGSRFVSVTQDPIDEFSSKETFYVGPINRKHGPGLVIAQSTWDGAHYAPSRYRVTTYEWNQKRFKFLKVKELITKKQFNTGEEALKQSGLPHDNLLYRGVSPGEISTLGIEMLLPAARPQARDHP